MVRLIQLPHLVDRVKGMLFQVRFELNMELLRASLALLEVACVDLRGAKSFQQLLNVILTMGNYLNGTNFAGGAYGFKIASINKLVDTKSSAGQNLLHFLERTVNQHFPDLEGFLDELAKPSEANRVNFSDMQATSKQMLDEIRHIRRSLEQNFQQSNDGYARKMFRFSATAEEELQTLRDGIINSESHLRDVETYYGEGEEHGRPIQSQDFFGIFRTFTSSYKVSKVICGWS
jgi:cytokinesis protein